jgi:hypothetical protein
VIPKPQERLLVYKNSGDASLVIRLICPKCHEDSYVVSVEVFKPCPYCGCVFSGKYGIEKREEKRTRREIPFIFPYKGQNLEARTVNFSDRGLGIEIFGAPPLARDDVIELTVGDLQIKATIMWVERLPDKVLSGLKRLN